MQSLLSFRHAGLDPAPRFATPASGTPDQVRGDDEMNVSGRPSASP
ncbi:hypothetical protein SC1_01898 [Sphingopyxis sp. C-1]|nr:hypothetical protein SC1_01898 [Sphingopyxis sp. C-1]